MNRAIKFRAKVKRDAGIWAVDAIDWKGQRVYLDGARANWHPIAKIQHLMQYTGLTDKNGKEIYEGDIVSALFRGGTPTVFAVEYEEHHGEWQDQYFVGFDFGDIQSKSVEVIGNIYENPDLLK